MARRVLVLAALLVAGPAATAGPISWAYSLTVETATGQSNLFLGRYQYFDRDVTRDVYATAALPTAGAAGTATGDATITLAGVSKGGYRLADTAPEGATADSFRVLLEITDEATGRHGFTPIAGRGALTTALPMSLASEVELRGDGRVLMQLGDSRFDIRTRATGTESTSRLLADITVTSVGGPTNNPVPVPELPGPTASTPEPASLLLAGLGLGAVGVRRLRRRG